MTTRRSILVLAALITLSFLQSAPVSAWGPERPTYTMSSPADHPTFNSITDNSTFGDERDFVRIVEKGSGKAFTSDLEIEANKEYIVEIYYHNNASATYNDAAHNYVGVAEDTRVVSYFPEKLAAGETGQIDGVITATNADPKTVWDEARITAKENLKIGYVEGTARIYNDWGVNGTELDKKLFTSEGVFIGLNELNGLVLGCEEYSGQIVYTIQTQATEEDSDPGSTPDDMEELQADDAASKKASSKGIVDQTPKALLTVVVILGLIVIILGIALMRLLHKKKH